MVMSALCGRSTGRSHRILIPRDLFCNPLELAVMLTSIERGVPPLVWKGGDRHNVPCPVCVYLARVSGMYML
jgi:hypothetical protein